MKPQSSPVYLEPEIESFVSKLAKEQKTNLNEIVNNLLFQDKKLFECIGMRWVGYKARRCNSCQKAGEPRRFNR